MDSLELFKRDLGSYVRVYEFLGQIFDYGNTDYEKLYLFAKMLYPLLDYGREREGIDLSALRLTHHRMRDLGQQKLNLGKDDPVAPLAPITDTGSGQVQDRQKQRLAEIIAALNDLFEGVTDGDKVSHAETLKGKMLESPVLRSQAAVNTEEQFSNSPNRGEEFLNAIIGAIDANQTMRRQALNSDGLRAQLLGVLLGPGRLWEALRGSGQAEQETRPS